MFELADRLIFEATSTGAHPTHLNNVTVPGSEHQSGVQVQCVAVVGEAGVQPLAADPQFSLGRPGHRVPLDSEAGRTSANHSIGGRHFTGDPTRCPACVYS